jgi:exosome complex RNA-binding protein Csl4
MKAVIGLTMCAAILNLGMGLPTYAANEPATAGPQSIKGDILKIEGEHYTVQDMSGHDVRVHVDKTTKMDGLMKTGDNVEVQVTDKGHAFSMTHTHLADKSMPLGPKTVQGDVLKIDGAFYVVHDRSGKEVRIHVDETTTMDGLIKAGDNVEAQVTDKSHALSMKHGNPAK